MSGSIAPGMCLSPERCLAASAAYLALRRMGAKVVGLHGCGPSSHVDTARVHGPFGGAFIYTVTGSLHDAPHITASGVSMSGRSRSLHNGL